MVIATSTIGVVFRFRVRKILRVSWTAKKTNEWNLKTKLE